MLARAWRGVDPLPRRDLAEVTTFVDLVRYLRDELDWPVDEDSFDESSFEYSAEEIGLDPSTAAKVASIRQLRPLKATQPWGVFFIEFERKQLPVIALRRILGGLALKKRASANPSERAAWKPDDLMFISGYGESSQRQLNFAHFASNENTADRPTLKVLGWDSRDTPLHLRSVAATLAQSLSWPDDDSDVDAWRQQWRSAFTLRHREVITTSRDLSVRLADLARSIRDRISAALSVESDAGPLTQMMSAFRVALIHDLDADGFADMYAQTIAYGLLSARVVSPPSVEVDASLVLPLTTPFLRELMEAFVHVAGDGDASNLDRLDFDEFGVTEIVELLDVANMEAVVRDFGDRNPQEDPVIHFYELFLKEYDAGQKLQRGVFYTPRPIVAYIVQAVHELLRTEFDLKDGLGDTATWDQVLERHPHLEIPEGIDSATAFVQILDPGTGTGTFLVEVIDLIHRHMTERWRGEGHSAKQLQALWNEYVPVHLLPRLHGYELLMAPYAIAHLKVGLKLVETGYDFASDTRVRIYLTNALEPAQDFSDRLEFAIPALAHEAAAVNRIKRHQRFTVVIGNPPYSIRSANLTDQARALVEPFKFIAGQRIVEKGALQLEKNLNDDYVKFFGLVQRLVGAAGVGIAGLITNHAFLDNPTFRGFRWNLADMFDHIRLLDLHGNSKKREQVPPGHANENVFDVQQGVAISILSRLPGNARAGIGLADMWGTRAAKYEALGIGGFEFATTSCEPPWYTFSLQDQASMAEYAGYVSLTDAMPQNSTGLKTHRDGFVIDFDKKALRERVDRFRSDVADEMIEEEFGLADTYGWRLSEARRRLRARPDWESGFRLCLYRPFDVRHIYYSSDLVELPRSEIMRHLLGGSNIALLATRQVTSPPFGHVLVTRLVNEMKTCSHDRGTNCFPLYLVSDDTELAMEAENRPNFSMEILRAFDGLTTGASDVDEADGTAAEQILHYAYAVFHSPEYRRRYSEFLKIDFPRMPLPPNRALFSALSKLGGELVALHLLESPKLDQLLTTYVGPPNPEVQRVGWADNTVWFDAPASKMGQRSKPGTSGIVGVEEAVWDFRIGGYQVCHKWLKDRKGRHLSHDDLRDYGRIVSALSATITLMQDIDAVIDHHGGWPTAFLS